MIPEDLADIAERHLAALVAQSAPESQTLEYKREPVQRGEAGRHELCADVVALANATGGDLVIGINQNDDGAAVAIVPFVGNADEESLRLLDIIANGVDPKVPGLALRPIPVEGGHVFVVRVPQSWLAPHRTKTNQHFYVRESARKRQLDMPEIRSAFVRSSRLADEIANFRGARVGRILAGEGSVPLLREGAISVLHIVPLGSAVAESAIDPAQYERGRQLPIIAGYPNSARINLDGAVASFEAQVRGHAAYTQLFRNGRVEAVRVFSGKSEDGAFEVPEQAFEVELIQFYEAITAELGRLGIGPPLLLAYSLLRAGNAILAFTRLQSFLHSQEQGRFDRETLLYPDVVVKESARGAVALRPIFDLVWQSAGLPRSRHYREDGTRVVG